MGFDVLKKQNVDIDKKKMKGNANIGGNAKVAKEPLTKQIINFCLIVGL